jgi:hypothetical protein
MIEFAQCSSPANSNAMIPGPPAACIARSKRSITNVAASHSPPAHRVAVRT